MKETYEKLFKIESDLWFFTEEIPATDLISLTKGEKLIKCQQLIDGKMINTFILEDNKYFILLKCDKTADSKAKLVKRIKIHDIKTTVDLYDPRSLVLRTAKVPLNSTRNWSEIIELHFHDIGTCRGVKNHIEECSQKILSQQVNKILKQLASNKKEEPK